MSPPDPPASDLGAVRARLAQPRKHWSASLGRLVAEVSPNDLDTLLAAYDAQAARLAAWEQHQCPQYRQHHQSRLVQLRRTIVERDALAAQLAAYRTALETIRDLDPLTGRVRPGPTSIGDTALAIANGLGKCQKLAAGAVGAGEATDG